MPSRIATQTVFRLMADSGCTGWLSQSPTRIRSNAGATAVSLIPSTESDPFPVTASSRLLDPRVGAGSPVEILRTTGVVEVEEHERRIVFGTGHPEHERRRVPRPAGHA